MDTGIEIVSVVPYFDATRERTSFSTVSTGEENAPIEYGYHTLEDSSFFPSIINSILVIVALVKDMSNDKVVNCSQVVEFEGLAVA
jgi:hypothetical protein